RARQRGGRGGRAAGGGGARRAGRRRCRGRRRRRRRRGGRRGRRSGRVEWRPFARAFAQVLEEFGEQFVVVEVRFAELVVQRPGARVVVGNLGARLSVACFEQLQAERVLRYRAVVVQPHHGLDEAVEDAVARGVGVLGVVRA